MHLRVDHRDDGAPLGPATHEPFIRRPQRLAPLLLHRLHRSAPYVQRGIYLARALELPLPDILIGHIAEQSRRLEALAESLVEVVPHERGAAEPRTDSDIGLLAEC